MNTISNELTKAYYSFGPGGNSDFQLQYHNSRDDIFSPSYGQFEKSLSSRVRNTFHNNRSIITGTQILSGGPGTKKAREHEPELQVPAILTYYTSTHGAVIVRVRPYN